ncbi:ankyrin [Trypanosoma conorhini]|uniref:Ankyrin n=1 Tax=Trypanosoma conorhini TaxID=83891 RepID=A0A3S5ISF9_9TRYP|nr:ankyrin [Trypanosoma conorhini]RNF10991.1 ankyrin [Trypanosoma conorhini]
MDRSVFGAIEREDHAAMERAFSLENVNLVNADGYTPLYYASMKKNVGRRTVEQLLFLGAQVDLKGQDGETPLYIACFNSKIEVVQLLLENGANVNAKNGRDEETPLHVTARTGNCAILDILVGRGAKLDVQNVRGETPLYLAAKAGLHNAVYHLMNAGADVNICDVDGKDPLYVASERGLKHVVVLLKSSLKGLAIAKAMADEELRLRPLPIKSTELILEEAEEDAAAGRLIHHDFIPSKPVKEVKPLEIVKIAVPRPKAGPRNPFAATSSGPCRSLEEVGYDAPPALPPSLANRPPVKSERIGGTSMRIGTSVQTMGKDPPRISCVPGDCMEFFVLRES